MIKKSKILFLCLALSLISIICEAKGGFSSGDGARGGFSSSRSYGSANSYRAPSVSTRTTTTTTRTYSSNNVHQYGGGSCCGGMGMAYGYSNGLLTGMIIGNMMHPEHTVVYTGGGAYSNNALLYPDGRVVNQQGYVVGTYANGTFTAIQNGPMVAQSIPQDVVVQQQAQPVVIQHNDNEELVIAVIITGIIVFMMLAIFLI